MISESQSMSSFLSHNTSVLSRGVLPDSAVLVFTNTAIYELSVTMIMTLFLCVQNVIEQPKSNLVYFEKLIFFGPIPGGGLPYEEYMGVCHELGSYFQEKIPKTVCQFFTKIPERAMISVRNSR